MGQAADTPKSQRRKRLGKEIHGRKVFGKLHVRGNLGSHTHATHMPRAGGMLRKDMHAEKIFNFHL